MSNEGENAMHSKVEMIDSCRRALRAMCAGIDPGLDKLAEPRLRAGGRHAASAGVPTPGDQVVLGDVLMQQGQVAAAVTRPIFHLRAYFADRFAFPGHLNRSQAPACMSRDALIARSFRQREVTFRVAGGAHITGNAVPSIAPWNGWLVKVLIVALQRTVARRVAIHATRMCDDLGAFGEQRARPRRSVWDARKIRRRTQLIRLLSEDRAACGKRERNRLRQSTLS